MKPKLLLLAPLEAFALETIEQHYEVYLHERWADQAIAEDDLIAMLEEHRPLVLVLEAQPLTEKVLTRAVPFLKGIASVRTTPANIDLDCCRRLGIKVSTSPGRNAMAVVEMAIGLMLCCARMIPQAYMAVKSNACTLEPGTPRNEGGKDVIWHHPAITPPAYIRYRGIELSGKTLGLVGFGAIARMLVPVVKGFSMRVLVCDPYVSDEAASGAGVEKRELDALLAESDFVSLHAKVTPETVDMMNMDKFRRMKKTAYLINTARGALVRERDLYAALKERLFAGAALDVFESEPLYRDCPLLELDNLIVTPHIGGATADVVRHQSKMVAANAVAFVKGEAMPNQVA